MIKMSIKIPAGDVRDTNKLWSQWLFPFLFIVAILIAGLSASTPGITQEKSEVIIRIDQLPLRVRRMHQALTRAVRSGNVEKMRQVLQINELMPLINGRFIHDPIKYWKAQSPDGSGREILAALSEILELPPVKVTVKRQAIYIWPYFAVVPLDKLSSSELVRFYRLAPANKAAQMLKNNRYRHTQMNVGADGTWHSIEIALDHLLEKPPQKP
ncbi:MAG: hypothetical protein GY927_07200 [bacterium]|nr:hypothetical protein [bacterium]